MAITAHRMVAEATARVRNLDPDELAAELAGDRIVLVDLRDGAELEEYGCISGAVHAPRGMLEFLADPSSPVHVEALDRSVRTVLYCASGARSALAVSTLQRLGYHDVAHLAGGLAAWMRRGHPVERITRTCGPQEATEGGDA